MPVDFGPIPRLELFNRALWLPPVKLHSHSFSSSADLVPPLAIWETSFSSSGTIETSRRECAGL